MRKQLTTALLLFVSFTRVGVAAPPVVPVERFDWMPADGIDAKLEADDLGGEQILPDINLTPTPKPTADLAKFTRIYTIDLAKFGIFNDGTHADETSAGLNRALQDAKAAGANRIVFPAGTYQISENAPLVVDLHDAVIDFNGATLIIRPNGLPKYAVVEIIDGAENVRLTNGTLVGDRDAHDYKAAEGTHEWGQGIRFIGGRNLEVDHMTLRDMTGDGASSTTSGTRTRPELLAVIKHSLFPKEFEAGAFNERGEPVPGPKMRSIKPYDATKCDGEFELGYYGGYMGYPFIKGRVYQAYFFDAEMRLLERRKCLQYHKTRVPAAAKWLHLEFNQPEIADEPAHAGASKGSWFARITNLRPSVDVHFHHNTLVRNRRLGMAFCGGQRWLLEDNLFAENRGTNPAYGIDFEDGAELVYDVVFRRNKFRDNGNGDLVVCAGSELIFEDNEFEKSVVTWGRAHHYVFRRNHYRGGSVSYTTRTGVADIHDNRYENCKLAIRFDTKGVADGLVRKAGQKVATPPLQLRNETLVDVPRVEGTYFDLLDCKLQNAHFTAGAETRLVRLRGGEARDSSIAYEADGPIVNVQIEKVTGQVTEAGPGLTRKQELR